MKIRFVWGGCVGAQGASTPKPPGSGPAGQSGKDIEIGDVHINNRRTGTDGHGAAWARCRSAHCTDICCRS
jgi:hypothetical protein